MGGGTWIGIDFGTTNSGAALFEGGEVHAFALDPASRTPTVMRSALYVTRDHELYVGQEAIDRYYRENVGRPSRMVRQHVGEIEITLGDVGTVKGYPVGPQEIVRDVYALVDALAPGRLLYSLKSALATGYEGTTVFGQSYTLEELIAGYLRVVRERAEAEMGRRVAGAVLGRPVHFGAGTAGDLRAERRLRRAAEMAGLGEVRFELEPVAAALYYARTMPEPGNVLVFDLGGGTLDITVMRVGGGAQEVYASGGVSIAGDRFDRRLAEGVLLDHFGRGSTWGPDNAPFPSQYTDALLDWQALPELSRPETLRFLRQAQQSSSHPRQLQALLSLLVHNEAARMIDAVEQAKIALSTERFAAIVLQGEDMDIWQPVTRTQFEALIADERAQIDACLLDTLARSGLSADEVDVVVRTGGSAQIPCLADMIAARFGADKVVVSDVFGSVTAGLAIRAAGWARA
ncbi:MAG: Hsp70 family protein [Anaerolineae bacterium]|nr:Hsp70 family protein [Anaerolineae bacterium]